MFPITLNQPLPGDIDWTWDWSKITSLKMMYYIPESGDDGVYDFQILAELDEVLVSGELVYREVVLTGYTEVQNR